MRFYAGAPLKTRDGLNIGTFCIIDCEPREFTDSEQASLADLASIVIDEMELRMASRQLVLNNLRAIEEAEKEANTDPMTGLGNRRAFEADVKEFEKMIMLGNFSKLMVTVIDLDGLKQINDTLGHAKGDYFIKAFSSGLKNILRVYDRVYRIGGDEFVIFSPISSEPNSLKIKDRFTNVIEKLRIETGFGDVDASVGVAVLLEVEFNLQQVLEQADKRMYEEKNNRVISRLKQTDA